jgi:hypothetical protein
MAGPAFAATLVSPQGYDDVLVVAIGMFGLVWCVMALALYIAARN